MKYALSIILGAPALLILIFGAFIFRAGFCLSDLCCELDDFLEGWNITLVNISFALWAVAIYAGWALC